MCNTLYASQLSVRGHWKLVCEECRPRTHITSPGCVCGYAHSCSPVPPVPSHDRFCGTSHWRQGLERQKHGIVACGQHKYLRSSLVDSSSLIQVLVAVLCYVVLQSGVVLCVQQQQTQEPDKFSKKWVWGKKIVLWLMKQWHVALWQCGISN